MPVSWLRASQERTEVALSVRGETLTVGFNAAGITPEFFAALPEVLEGDVKGGLDSLIQQLRRLILDWDLMDGEGPDAKALPITDETLRGMDIRILRQIMEAINKATSPNEAMTQN